MNELLTGAGGYIGARLLPQLLDKGHHVYCVVRSKERFHTPESERGKVTVLEHDFLEADPLPLPKDLDAAYFLIHSMTTQKGDFHELEAKAAENYVKSLENTSCKQQIYLGGLLSSEELSKHLQSRKNVEEILKKSSIPTTILRAGIIIGSGSASFEILRDLVEKLPVMVAPKWVKNRCQPIAIRDVLFYLTEILGKSEAYGKTFDIGGPDRLTYKEMLEEFAKVRGLRRTIFTVPVLTPRLSSYWLYYVTATNYQLAKNLVDSLKNEVVCHEHSIDQLLPREKLGYKEAIQRAFEKIEQFEVISSWKDAMGQSELSPHLENYIRIPEHGCLKDQQVVPFTGPDEGVIHRFFTIGGKKGWYVMNWAWKLRGLLDKMVGGVGLRRGRTHPDKLQVGEALDFWRVLHADPKKGRLLLYAEMRLPGEAWLEFKISKLGEKKALVQTASFRPSGLLGRLYWYSLLPFHLVIFRRMARHIAGE